MIEQYKERRREENKGISNKGEKGRRKKEKIMRMRKGEKKRRRYGES